MKLSKNFTLSELSVTNTGDYNTPPEDVKRNLLYLSNFILQPIRSEVGSPIHVTSGYRSGATNSAVGGSNTSQHLYGEAADLVFASYDIDVIFDWVVEVSDIAFGQAILENKDNRRWVHISLPRLDKPNREALIYSNGIYKPYQ